MSSTNFNPDNTRIKDYNVILLELVALSKFSFEKNKDGVYSIRHKVSQILFHKFLLTSVYQGKK